MCLCVSLSNLNYVGTPGESKRETADQSLNDCPVVKTEVIIWSVL